MTAQSMLGLDNADVEILRPSIAIGFSVLPSASLSDGSGTYRMQSRTMQAAIPVYERIGGGGYTGVLLRANASLITPELSVLSEDHRLYTTTLGVTAGYVSSERNFYSLSLNAGIAEDRSTISAAQLRLSGTGIGSLQAGSSVSVLYGVSYSYTFDRGRWLPLVGVRWGFADDWSFSTLLPFSIRVRYHPDKRWSLSVVLRPAGNQFRVSSGSDFPGAPDVITMRVYQIQAGGEFQYRLDNSMLLQVDAGTLGGRRIAWSDGDQDLRRLTLERSGYLMVGLRFSFGATVFEEEF